ncbi:HAD family hydrolase [Cupriavidus necator]
MNFETRYPAIIFDLDGTLIDSWPSLVATLHACLSDSALDLPRLKLELSAGIAPMFAQATAQAAIAVGQQEHKRAQLLTRYLDEFVLDATLYPGVPELLAQLRATGARIGICTNRDRASTLQLLCRHGLDTAVDALVCVGDTAQPKPHPQPLHACLAQLPALPGQALFVGDSHIDAQCAHAAGVPFAAHLGGYHRHPDDLAPAALRFDSFAQLAHLMGR